MKRETEDKLKESWVHTHSLTFQIGTSEVFLRGGHLFREQQTCLLDWSVTRRSQGWVRKLPTQRYPAKKGHRFVSLVKSNHRHSDQWRTRFIPWATAALVWSWSWKVPWAITNIKILTSAAMSPNITNMSLPDPGPRVCPSLLNHYKHVFQRKNKMKPVPGYFVFVDVKSTVLNYTFEKTTTMEWDSCWITAFASSVLRWRAKKSREELERPKAEWHGTVFSSDEPGRWLTVRVSNVRVRPSKYSHSPSLTHFLTITDQRVQWVKTSLTHTLTHTDTQTHTPCW